MFHDQVSSALGLQPLLRRARLAKPGDKLSLVAQLYDAVMGMLQSESPLGKFTCTLNLCRRFQWLPLLLSVFVKA